MAPEPRKLAEVNPQPAVPIDDNLRGTSFRPARPEDRGTLEFECPNCAQVLITEMSEEFAARAPMVFCGFCEVWLSPTGRSF